MKRSWTVILALLLCAALILPSCGPKKAAVIKVGEVTRSLFYAPQYVALSQGFFEDEGLQVELQTTAGGDKTMTAILSGTVDIGLVGSETSIYVEQQGAADPVINFAQLTQTDGTFLFARTPVTPFDWYTLKGADFLGQRKGGMPQMAGEFTLKKKGIDPHKDMNLIQNVDFANIAPAFASGTGAFVQLFEPQASVFEKEGKGAVVASFGVESGHLPYTVFMAKRSFLDKHADEAQKFTNAIHRAQKWVAEKSVDDIVAAITEFFPSVDKDILASSVNRYKEQDSFAADPIIDEAEWNNLQDVMEAAGELKARSDYTKLVDNRFAEKAKATVK